AKPNANLWVDTRTAQVGLSRRQQPATERQWRTATAGSSEAVGFKQFTAHKKREQPRDLNPEPGPWKSLKGSLDSEPRQAAHHRRAGVATDDGVRRDTCLSSNKIMKMGVKVYQNLKVVIKKKYVQDATKVAMKEYKAGLELLKTTIKKAGYTGKVVIGMNVVPSYAPDHGIQEETNPGIQ
ncbi:hypothetical protein ACLOJK_018289, partial [Asimina triloba]